MRKRWSSQMGEIRTFYDAMSANVEAALDYLDRFDVDLLPEPEARLLYLSLSLVEVANAIEVYDQPRPFNALPPERYEPVEAD